jgi:ATP-dependent DNA helicase RecQ
VTEQQRADLRRAGLAAGWELTDHQLDAAEAVVGGRDAVAVLPTGAGKSAIYQVSGEVLGGLTVVVSPMVALQHDQVARMDEADLPAAAALNSQLTAGEVEELWRSVGAGQIGRAHV